MPEEIRFQITGLPELSARFQALPVDVGQKYLFRSVRKAADVIRDEARLRAPVRVDPRPKRMKKGVASPTRLPGFLKRHIVTRVRRTKFDQVVAKVGATAAAFYGRFQELGDAHQPARSFLRPALDTRAVAAIETMRADLWEQIRRGLPG